jgi:hypothetical protein
VIVWLAPRSSEADSSTIRHVADSVDRNPVTSLFATQEPDSGVGNLPDFLLSARAFVWIGKLVLHAFATRDELWAILLGVVVFRSAGLILDARRTNLGVVDIDHPRRTARLFTFSEGELSRLA